MKIFILFLLILIVLYALYVVFDIQRRTQIGKSLAAEAVPFEVESNDDRKTILVLGDSTAVGVGAESHESIAGLLAEKVGATYVENHAVSGAKIEEVEAQIAQAEKERYDIVLLQVGGNNIIGFDDVNASATNLASVLNVLKTRSEKVIHLSAGNVGAASAIPFFLKPLYHNLTLKYHSVFEKLANDIGTTYVNLYVPPQDDPFIKEPHRYLAPDGLHPTAAGYLLWFKMVWSVVEGKGEQSHPVY